MMRRERFVLLLTIIIIAVSPAYSQNKAENTGGVAVLPGALRECDGNQCRDGGGGALWVFEGTHGQAKWHYGAVADLTIESFDGRNIVIRRVDPAGTYSSRFAKPGQLFTGLYTGTLNGDLITGNVFGGTWYARIQKDPCDPFDDCPIDADQVFELGQNAARAHQYSAALFSFMIAAQQGNAAAQSAAGVMLSEGIAGTKNEAVAYSLLQQSAGKGDYNGALGLAQMYDLGEVPGQPRNAELAAFWRDQARQRLQQIQIQQQQRTQDQTTNAIAALAFMGVLGAVVANASNQNEPTGRASILDNISNIIDAYEQFEKIGRFVQQHTSSPGPTPQMH